MTIPPYWALSVSYWLHLLSTAGWISGLVISIWLAGPGVSENFEPQKLNRLINQFQNIGWFCLLVLAGTGMLQMSSSPNYLGFLAIQNRWAWAILLKHLAFGLILVINAYWTWGLNPALSRASLIVYKRNLQQGQPSSSDGTLLQVLQHRAALLLKINLALAIIVLGLTALARVS
jgi:hypothetical protein